MGSKLGVAGTIVGAAVASVVSTAAGAILGHSLERGKNAALKARPALEAFQSDRLHAARRQAPPGALDTTVILDGGTRATVAPEAETVPLPPLNEAPETRRTWRDRLPGRKPLLALTVASFAIGTGAVTTYTLARDGGVPGQNGSVFSRDGGHDGSHDSPAPQNPGEGSTGGASTHHPASPTPGASGSTTSPTPSTPPLVPQPGPGSGSSPSDSGSGSPTPTATTPSTGTTTPSTGPTTPGPTGSNTPTAPSSPATQGTTTPNAPGSATALGTPSTKASG